MSRWIFIPGQVRLIISKEHFIIHWVYINSLSRGGVCPKGLALNKTCPRGLRLAITLSRGPKMKSSCPRGGGGGGFELGLP